MKRWFWIVGLALTHQATTGAEEPRFATTGAEPGARSVRTLSYDLQAWSVDSVDWGPVECFAP